MATALTAAAALGILWLTVEAVRALRRIMRGESGMIRWRPDGAFVWGRGQRSLAVGEDGPVLIPSWCLGVARIFVDCRFRLGLYWVGSPLADATEGDLLWRRCVVVPLNPVRLVWLSNQNPSRAWTGRERELWAVEWWTPRGWRQRILRRS